MADVPTTTLPNLTPPSWEIGILCFVIVTLAGVIAYLYKAGNTIRRRKDSELKVELEKIAIERTAMAIERIKTAGESAKEIAVARADHAKELVETRADYEQKLREQLERHDEILRADREDARAHEDAVRKDFAAIMEKVADEANESALKLADALDKMKERLMIGPSRSRY